ncbi:hypothetical protein D9Q98_005850 [Chlorella vulgaris]|uniref:Uncharacterized protein n=1 Tax=Chlorella vulgaris TaxID=3077 RepID=A0A9D4TWH6_CHLVU|nr:hypothetical protein D9Q98_005850 [Chlorella vulgaris]
MSRSLGALALSQAGLVPAGGENGGAGSRRDAFREPSAAAATAEGGSELRPALTSQLQCPAYASTGSCAKGVRCPLAHGWWEADAIRKLKHPGSATGSRTLRQQPDASGAGSSGPARPAAAHPRQRCKYYFTAAGCARGDRCQFAHGASDARLPPPKQERLCRFRTLAQCPYHGCHFRHEPSDAPPLPSLPQHRMPSQQQHPSAAAARQFSSSDGQAAGHFREAGHAGYAHNQAEVAALMDGSAAYLSSNATSPSMPALGTQALGPATPALQQQPSCMPQGAGQQQAAALQPGQCPSGLAAASPGPSKGASSSGGGGSGSSKPAPAAAISAGVANTLSKRFNSLLCPITLEPFVDPVVAADGNIYERHAIEGWLYRDGNNASPLTNEPLAHKMLMPCGTMRRCIAEVAEFVADMQRQVL